MVFLVCILLLVTFSSASAQTSEAFAGGKDELRRSKRIEVGNIAPVFTGIDFKGETFDLNKYYQKKPIVLNFYSVTCASCYNVVRILEALRKKHKIVDDELIFVYVSLDSWKRNRETIPKVWQKIFNKSQIRINDKTREIGKNLYGVDTLPVTILIDKNGRVYYRRDDYNLDFNKQITRKIKKLLRK